MEATAAGLAGLGLRRGGTLAIMLTNRPEFHWFDSAALHLGATPFSLYNTYTRSRSRTRWTTRSQIVVTEQAFAGPHPGARGRVSRARRGRRAAAAASRRARPDGFDFEAAWRAVQPDDLLTLIYTSGTTGPPKGVQITHANLVAGSVGSTTS